MANDKMMLIQLGSGSQNFTNVTSKVFTYTLRPGGKAKLPPDTDLAKVGATAYLNACKLGGVNNGRWDHQRYEHKEGALVFITNMSSHDGGKVVIQGGMVLRLRATAAVIEVTARLRGHERSAMAATGIVVFQGRADILTVDEIRALRLPIPQPVLAEWFHPAEVDHAFRVNTIAKQDTPPPELRQVNGAAVFAPPAGARRVRVGRGNKE